MTSDETPVTRQVHTAQPDPDAFRIFISYRRPHAAGCLYEIPKERFKAEQLFMDVDTIPPGGDYVDVLTEAVELCDVLIAVIGKRWLTQRRGGTRRIDDPSDWMRIELEAALDREITLVPALTDGASMPTPAALPQTLRGITRKQAVQLDHHDFRVSATRLRESLEELARVKHESATRAARQRAEAEEAERQRLARDAAEREGKERAEREATARAQAERHEAERAALVRRIAEIDGWQHLSQAGRLRYAEIIEAVNESNLCASDLAARDGRPWILLDAVERLRYEQIVRVAAEGNA
jgi:TIR domain